MTANKRHYSILITDDDQGAREALREIVEPEGFRTVLAASGEEAVDIVRFEPVHLALIDFNMPTLTGLETLQLLRQFNDLLPAILVTGDANEAVRRQALQAKAFTVIPKPVRRNVILYMIVRALGRVYPDPTAPPNVKPTDATNETPEPPTHQGE